MGTGGFNRTFRTTCGDLGPWALPLSRSLSPSGRGINVKIVGRFWKNVTLVPPRAGGGGRFWGLRVCFVLSQPSVPSSLGGGAFSHQQTCPHPMQETLSTSQRSSYGPSSHALLPRCPGDGVSPGLWDPWAEPPAAAAPFGSGHRAVLSQEADSLPLLLLAVSSGGHLNQAWLSFSVPFLSGTSPVSGPGQPSTFSAERPLGGGSCFLHCVGQARSSP